MKALHLLLAAAMTLTFLVGCSDTAGTSTVVLQCSDATSSANADIDDDGYSPCDGDCDDADPDASPGTPEESETDGYDQDCDNFNPTRN